MSSLAELKKNQKVVEEEETPDDVCQLKAELERELMDIRFRMKLCKDLRKAGVKNTADLKKKYSNIYFRKLKIYCEVCDFQFEDDVKQHEVSIKVQELKRDMFKIAQGGSALHKLLKQVM